MTVRIGEVRTVYEGWSTFSVAEVELSDGTRIRREIEDHGRAVAVLPYDPERRVAILVEQLRTPVLKAAGLQATLEVPAGILEEEDPQAGARREVMEEVGVRLGALEHIAQAWAMPGISTERMDLFLAPYSEEDKVEQGGGLGAEHENITLVELSLDELAARLAQGTVNDMKTMTLLFALQIRHPELFGH
jgi:nudix-type nucleoside diphosphatase (YffH/AdpP family)